MLNKSFINSEYRHTAPDVESSALTSASGEVTETPPTLPVETTPETEPEAGTKPVDKGQDTIPEVNLWDSLSDDIDETEDEAPADSPVAKVEPEPVVEEVKPPQPPAVEEPKPAIEAKTEVLPEVTPPVVPAAETQPTKEPEPEPQVAPPPEVDIAQQRADMTTRLEEHYKLSEEDSLQMVTDPGKALPKIQARMFSDMWWNMTQMIRTSLPTVIESTLQDVKVRDEKVDSFFKQWPKLDRVKHGTQVAQVAKVFAQVNPTATEADVIKHVGMQVMLMAGMSPEMVPVNPAEPVVADTPAPLTPHKPAAVNALGGAQQPSNIWAQMSEEIDDDG